MLTPEKKKDFILSQWTKLCFNEDMQILMTEYRQLAKLNKDTTDKVNEIEVKVESILLGNW